MPPSNPGDSDREDPQGDDLVGHDREFRQPLPPDDRIWRHPSEVAAAARAQSTVPDPGLRVRASVATVAISALIGATLSLGIVAALGGFDTRVVERRIAVDPTDGLGPDGGMAGVTSRTAPSVVGVTVRHGDRWIDGNAVVLRSDGHLVTTESFVDGADEIEIHFDDGERRFAEIVGGDPVTDVALLRVDRDGLTPAAVGSAEALAVGDEAVVIGLVSNGDWQPILTRGLVSAVHHRVDDGDTTFHGLVLLDAAVPDHTSGAAVVDGRGAVIGLIAATGRADDGTPVIPIDDAVSAADDILEFGHARHVWLGVGGRDVGRDDADELGVASGAAVSTVLPDSPAERSGLRAGDVITGLDGSAIKSMSGLVLALRHYDPGDTVSVTVVRDGESTTIDAELVERDL